MNQVMVNNRNDGGYGGGCGGYATWQPVQQNNWLKLKPRRFAKKKFSKSAPLAPRNTTSFLIRAKKSGGIASLVSPCAATPAVLPTPVFSPSREVLGDMAKEEWGVDGYGSMKGLIRVRNDDDDEEDSGLGEGVIDVERRFEMVYPSNGGGNLESRVDDQGSHIARLEEENVMLKERLFYMEREFGELRTRLQSLEVKKQNDCGSNDNDNSDGNQCSVHIEGGYKMDNNDENECSFHNEDHKMEDEDNEIVEAKEKDLNRMVVNVDSSDISIELTDH
ncbi:hypothetical protein CTI12_AA045770 [Artemisia annua]|uniref:PRLI-interacting factor A n=1 Tax=Artemisia annua TaxID=35608 RepID=A0A2U1QCV8_ARTAN|nr:hypothetical protein CTI12_AA045770 [Artemisia annua]